MQGPARGIPVMDSVPGGFLLRGSPVLTPGPSPEGCRLFTRNKNNAEDFGKKVQVPDNNIQLRELAWKREITLSSKKVSTSLQSMLYHDYLQVMVVLFVDYLYTFA
jgi:hypothetical protein